MRDWGSLELQCVELGTTSGYGGSISGQTVPSRSAGEHAGGAVFRNFGFGRLYCTYSFCPPSPNTAGGSIVRSCAQIHPLALQLTESQHRAELRSEYQQASKGLLKEGEPATSRR
jgi:hypothetical protein